MPHPPTILGWDKAQHSLAFVTLILLFSVSYPNVKTYWLAGALATFGGIIELLQALPMIHRDCDPVDWMTDITAIAVGMIGFKLARRIWQ